MTALCVIGIDPGPVPGFVRLHFKNGRLVARWTHVLQCSANVAPEILLSLLNDPGGLWPNTIVATERFVVGRRAARSSTAHAGAVTRDLVGLLGHIAREEDAPLVERSAAQVKPWATDNRLKAVQVSGTSLLDLVSSVGRHARDAARHALFAAVHDGGVPDPLSTKEISR